MSSPIPTSSMSLPAPAAVPTANARSSLGWDAYRRIKRDKLAVVCFWIILVYIVMALLARFGVLYPNVSLAVGPQYLPSSLAHPFGTDIQGRDILARAIHGTVTALAVGFIASGISLVIGISLGAIAGYFGGLIDAAVVWLYTVVDSIPYILLIPSLILIMGRGVVIVYIAVGVTSWVTICRLVRGEFMKHKDRDYVLAAEMIGAGSGRKIFRHILPNVAHIGFVQFGLGFVSAIKFEVILSYLGVGVDPSTPSWGIMLDDAKLELSRPFWGNLIAATVFMFFLILAFNLFNDALRESLDPKLKNK